MKVSARISDGLARRVAISQAIRRVMTCGLAGAGAGHDEERSLLVRDGPALVGVQAAEQGVQARVLAAW